MTPPPPAQHPSMDHALLRVKGQGPRDISCLISHYTSFDNQQSLHFSLLGHPRCQAHGHLQALAQAAHSPEYSSSPALASVTRAWLAEKAPTLDLRVFQQEQEGVADRGADGHRPRKQQINDIHQQVLVSEFCV